MQRVIDRDNSSFSRKSCDDCGGKTIVQEGFITCRSCGLVLEHNFDTLLPLPDLDEVSSALPSSYNLGNLHPALTQDRYWVGSPINQYLLKQYFLLMKICLTLELTKQIGSRALFLFDRLSNENGKYQNQILIAVAIIKATREEKYPLEHEEVLDALRKHGKNVQRNRYNRCLMDLNIKLPVYKPADYISRYLSDLHKHFNREEFPTPQLLHDLLKLHEEFFKSYKPSTFAFCCIVISFNIVYQVSRYSVAKIYRDNPTSYYPLLERILSKYNEKNKTNLSFQLKGTRL